MMNPEVRADAVIEALRVHPMLLMALQRKILKVGALRAWRVRDKIWIREDYGGITCATVRELDGSWEAHVFQKGGIRCLLPTAHEGKAVVDADLKGVGVVLAG